MPSSPAVAVIKVGGATEIEVKDRKDRVDDALNAARAAVEEGIVPGGGVGLLRAKKTVETLKLDNADIHADHLICWQKRPQSPRGQRSVSTPFSRKMRSGSPS